MDIDYNKLKTFLAVVRAGGVTAAAKKLHRTQSAVSQALQSLEGNLGVAIITHFGNNKGCDMRKKSQKEKLEDDSVEVGSGNVYADLGFENPEEMLAKAHLVSEIQKAIQRKKLTQTEAAERLKLTQPKLSMLLKGHFGGYSSDRLIRFLRILGQDIDIFISEKPRNRQAHLHVYSSHERSYFPMAAKSA